VDDQGREVRLVRTQNLFRGVNERMRLFVYSAFGEFACECGDARCAENVSLTAEEYEAVRREPARFLVTPEHAPAGDRVVEESDRYWVVEKVGRGAQLARELDPRGAAATQSGPSLAERG
jgi:hypothetical protein